MEIASYIHLFISLYFLRQTCYRLSIKRMIFIYFFKFEKTFCTYLMSFFYFTGLLFNYTSFFAVEYGLLERLCF